MNENENSIEEPDKPDDGGHHRVNTKELPQSLRHPVLKVVLVHVLIVKLQDVRDLFVINIFGFRKN